MGKNRGFTLIELMVTIVVLAVIASIAAPSFSKLLATYQANKSNEELLVEKYIRTKEDLKNIPIIADIDEMQIKDIRLIFQAVALAFEKITGVMASVVMEMSHEGFGRVVVFAEKIVLCEKFFKDAHRYSFREYSKLEEEGE